MIAELIERLEKAEGPEREIDARLCAELYDIDEPAQAFKLGVCPPRSRHHADWRVDCVGMNGVVRSYTPRHYTSSLDAALSLVERKLPGTEWAVSTLCGRNHAEVNMNAVEPVTAQGATPALAVCLALLRALSKETP